MPGNEEQDAILVAAAAGRPAYVVASAAARGNPDAACATARRWFRRFDVTVEELRVRTAAEARDADTAAQAAEAGLIYLAGGDPGLVVKLLSRSAVWAAVVAAWRRGAALAGSSAGAMALCRWTLVRERWPVHSSRRWADALGLVPGCAVAPHFDTFGEGWLPSAQAARPDGAVIAGIDERTAAVFHDGRWRVAGPGRVSLAAGDRRDVFSAGETVEGLPRPPEHEGNGA
jgi:cyanophycinase